MILLGKCICAGACLCGAAAFALYVNHCLIESAKHVKEITKYDIENAAGYAIDSP
jgi:hypothetical protein